MMWTVLKLGSHMPRDSTEWPQGSPMLHSCPWVKCSLNHSEDSSHPLMHNCICVKEFLVSALRFKRSVGSCTVPLRRCPDGKGSLGNQRGLPAACLIKLASLSKRRAGGHVSSVLRSEGAFSFLLAWNRTSLHECFISSPHGRGFPSTHSKCFVGVKSAVHRAMNQQCTVRGNGPPSPSRPSCVVYHLDIVPRLFRA